MLKVKQRSFITIYALTHVPFAEMGNSRIFAAKFDFCFCWFMKQILFPILCDLIVGSSGYCSLENLVMLSEWSIFVNGGSLNGKATFLALETMSIGEWLRFWRSKDCNVWD